jgi:hypothetical protein
LNVDDIADSIKFEDVPKPCDFGTPVEPGSNAHDGRERYDKPDGHVIHKRAAHHIKRVSKRCQNQNKHKPPKKMKRDTNDIRNTIEDIINFYKEMDELKSTEAENTVSNELPSTASKRSQVEKLKTKNGMLF